MDVLMRGVTRKSIGTETVLTLVLLFKLFTVLAITFLKQWRFPVSLLVLDVIDA